MNEYRLVEPPAEIFENDPKALWTNPENPNAKIHLLDEKRGKDGIVLPKEGGILRYFVGCKYPVKGAPFPEAVRETQIAKRTLLNLFKFLSEKPIIYFLPVFFLLPKGWKDRIVWQGLRELANLLATIIYPHRLKSERFCKSGREIYRIGQQIKTRLPENRKEIVEQLIITLCSIWEFDNTYRYRGQDIFGELDEIAFLNNPEKETIRLLDILIEREVMMDSLKEKWRRIRKVVYWFVKFHKKEIRNFVRTISVNLENLKLDDGDWYHCLVRPDYNYKGISFEERMKIRKQIDLGYKREI